MAQDHAPTKRKWRSPDEVQTQLLAIWRTMVGSVRLGCAAGGTLPGRIRRRAAELQRSLSCNRGRAADPLAMLDWVNLYAMAVNR